MQDSVFIAIVGLLALISLEIVFFIVLAALKKRSPAAPKIVFPEQKGQERYGWEDYLQLPVKKRKGPGNNVFVVVLIIAAMLVMIAVPSYMFGIPRLFSNATVNGTVVEDVEVSEPPQTEIASNFSLNISLPRLNLSMPKLNTSGLRELRAKASLYKPYIYSVIVAVVVLAAALAVFIYVVNRRKLAVIKKAGKTADRLMMKERKPRPVMKKLFSGISGIRPHLAPIVILFLLVVIALTVYLLRDRIRTGLADSVLSALISVKVFALNYRIYIAVGVLALIAGILALRRLKNKSKKN